MTPPKRIWMSGKIYRSIPSLGVNPAVSMLSVMELPAIDAPDSDWASTQVSAIGRV